MHIFARNTLKLKKCSTFGRNFATTHEARVVGMTPTTDYTSTLKTR